MINRKDCLILLADMQSKGIDTTEQTQKLLETQEVSLEILKFINDNRQLDVAAFYERLRKNYNNKKSSLYINIVKEDYEDPTKILTTLSAMLNQILLYTKGVENKQMFLRHARANEISKVLSIYFNTMDITNCINLMKIIRVDLKALESIK